MQAQLGYAHDIVALPDGGGIFFGSTEATTGFFDLPVASSGTMMARYDSDGDPQWVQSLDSFIVHKSVLWNNGIHLIASGEGSVLEWGGSSHPLDSTQMNYVSARFSLNGDLEWITIMQNAGWMGLNSISVNNMGESFIGAGLTGGLILGGDTIAADIPATQSAIFKLDPSGALLWLRLLGCENSGYSDVTALAADMNGGCLVAGSLTLIDSLCSNYTIGAQQFNGMNTDYLARLDNLGDPIWAIGGQGAYIIEVAMAAPDTFVVCGEFWQSFIVGLDTLLQDDSSMQGLLLWLSGSGEPILTRSTTTTPGQYNYGWVPSVACHDGMVYALGCGRGLTSYLGEPAATPDEHIFLTVFANDGAFLCTNSLVITPPNTQSIFYKLAVSIDPECSAHVSGVVKFNDPLKLALEWDGQSTPLGASTSLFMAKSSQSSLGTGVEYEPPLSLHPNPCRDGFWLNKLGPVVRGSITIRMTDGKLIRSYDGIYSNAFVPTADMGPGVYSVVSVFDGTTSSQILTVLN